jgi:lipopolysaccharide transport system ATP-binding protein
MSTVIKVENLSKSYRLGSISTGSLHKDLQSFWARVRGKEDPNRRIGETGYNHSKGYLFWALRDVSFEVKQGQVLGILGRNGAGKSTLLKILSRITAPSHGSVKIRGRIASLLEVGTGFHPELTGRENVYLNGAILGMTKREIDRKFDEIVDFAEIEQFIDTPVKRYSSGMYVRLAFAVAAHLESEILIVDEVLAVGDARFQKKCLGKMGDVSKNGGRTVLFVSHNMSAISNLCKSSLLLDHGVVQHHGLTGFVIDQYLNRHRNQASAWLNVAKEEKYASRRLALAAVSIVQNRLCTEMPLLSEPFEIRIDYVVREPIRATTSIHLLDKEGNYVLASLNLSSAMSNEDPLSGQLHEPGGYTAICEIPAYLLNEALYRVNVIILSGMHEVEIFAEEIISFTTYDDTEMRRDNPGNWIGAVRPKLKWLLLKNARPGENV